MSTAVLEGKTLFVDSVSGRDSTAKGGDATRPFATIAAAIAAAASGDLILIRPGTYTLTAGFTIPAGVSIRGASTLSVKLQMAASADTTLITMGENSRIEDMTVELTASTHVNLKAVLFPGTTSQTAKIRVMVITVDQTAAGAGTSDAIGVHAQSTGTPGREVNAIRATTVTVKGAGTGTKRGLLVDTSVGNWSARDTNFVVTGSVGIGAEINIASGRLSLFTGIMSGPTADVSRTAGDLECGTCKLENANANGKAFTSLESTGVLIWSDPGMTGSATRFVRVSGNSASSEMKYHSPRPAVGMKLSAQLATVPGAGESVVLTIRKNGVDTAITVTISGTNDEGFNTTDSIQLAEGDEISLKEVTTMGFGGQGLVATLELY